MSGHSVLLAGAAVMTLAACGTSDPAAVAGEAGRLSAEPSPYLQLHADNAVNWYPWGEEALARAREEDKPIFLSIGYSACHWCHVMEEESFLSAEVAALLDDSYVSILVDREERPDLDSLYITAANILSGQSGWPLTVVMTPTGVPFYASTYIPRESRPGQIGMLDLLPFLADAWKTRRAEITTAAAQVTEVLSRLQGNGAPAILPDAGHVRSAVASLKNSFDPVNGGFADRPKFPQPHVLLFMLRSAVRNDDQEALRMVEQTLTEIRHGGIYDQVGFGMHRYATDSSWLTPHFEKMLYDQALMSMVYVEAWRATGNPLFGQTAREILDYVSRDMTSRRGGFYAAEDSDSEGEEGAFYLWTESELEEVLGEQAGLYVPMLGASAGGNFVDERSGTPLPVNVLHLPQGFSLYAARRGMPVEDLQSGWGDARRVLLESRDSRPRPFRDEKILTDWNGLMIAAFAAAGRAFGEPAYVRTARRALDFVTGRMTTEDGRLLHLYFDGRAEVPGFLEDYAFLLWGVLNLYEATFEPGYLETASALADVMEADFADPSGGGYFLTAAPAETVVVRQKVSLDTDLPSGNSVAMTELARLARFTGQTRFSDRAWNVAGAFGSLVERLPQGHAHMLGAVEFLLNPSYEVVVVGRPRARDTREMLGRLNALYQPGLVVIRKDVRDQRLAEVAEFTRYQSMLDGKSTAYVCENFVCNLPTTDPDVMMELLAVGRE